MSIIMGTGGFFGSLMLNILNRKECDGDTSLIRLKFMYRVKTINIY